MTDLPTHDGPYDIVRLFYSVDDDRFYLVSHDETMALPLPFDVMAQMQELRSHEDDRLHSLAGFVPWSPARGIDDPPITPQDTNVKAD